ncbi:hypothetical protein HDU85_002449 [Gaertneriomyces sp. JEL0708]|nr:hypothetical protein HDU85_002449 [Gaertneriomyces sp. JEL0708]
MVMASPSESVMDESPRTKANNGTVRENFVRKLRNMVADRQYQHLISWNYSGTSFIVCNVLQFSREVLPKHFKHNNFSSFVRQLNMYGFHKVNKSPRGSRTLAENQVWEFSHAKFLRDRPHLCDEIKRKSVETETFRKEASDIYAQLQVIHVNQADIMQQLQQMQERFGEMAKEMSEGRRRQIIHERMMKNMMDFMKEQYLERQQGQLGSAQQANSSMLSIAPPGGVGQQQKQGGSDQRMIPCELDYDYMSQKAATATNMAAANEKASSDADHKTSTSGASNTQAQQSEGPSNGQNGQQHTQGQQVQPQHVRPQQVQPQQVQQPHQAQQSQQIQQPPSQLQQLQVQHEAQMQQHARIQQQIQHVQQMHQMQQAQAQAQQMQMHMQLHGQQQPQMNGQTFHPGQSPLQQEVIPDANMATSSVKQEGKAVRAGAHSSAFYGFTSIEDEFDGLLDTTGGFGEGFGDPLEGLRS